MEFGSEAYKTRLAVAAYNEKEGSAGISDQAILAAHAEAERLRARHDELTNEFNAKVIDHAEMGIERDQLRAELRKADARYYDDALPRIEALTEKLRECEQRLAVSSQVNDLMPGERIELRETRAKVADLTALLGGLPASHPAPRFCDGCSDCRNTHSVIFNLRTSLSASQETVSALRLELETERESEKETRAALEVATEVLTDINTHMCGNNTESKLYKITSAALDTPALQKAVKVAALKDEIIADMRAIIAKNADDGKWPTEDELKEHHVPEEVTLVRKIAALDEAAR